MKVSGIEIVKRIDEILSIKNESRTTLEQIGIKMSTISNWYVRDSTPKIDDVFNIAHFLGVSVEYLAFGIENKNLEMLAKFEKLSESEKYAVNVLIEGFLQKKSSSCEPYNWN